MELPKEPFEELKKSLSGEGERLLNDLLHSPGLMEDIFSGNTQDKDTENETGGTIVRIACLDIGSYPPQNMSFDVQDGYVTVRGKRTGRVNKGVEGAKFSRMLPIPEGVVPTKISARYNARDGQYIVEGVKVESENSVRKRKSSYAYSDETRMTLTVDIGSERFQQVSCGSSFQQSAHSKPEDKIVI